MSTFKTDLNKAIDIIYLQLGMDATVAVYYSDIEEDTAIVHLLELDGTNKVHDYCKRLANIAPDHFEIGHDSPTNGYLMVCGLGEGGCKFNRNYFLNRFKDLFRQRLLGKLNGFKHYELVLDYALSYYGLIPERVYEITSATMRMKKEFDTPLGRFTYKPIPLQAYALGVDWFCDNIHGGKLIATSEKALCDKIRSDRGIGRLSQQKLRDYLEFDLRIDMDLLYTLDTELIMAIATAYRSSNLKNLSKLISKRKQSA